eukprot:TRINITY_DN4424_c0_g7_i1.p1 TRINITY_DN4424_c0_g7~~TRINITY_DN4424_c0_g7_i1.p1  ORF type:complete len:290 (-),score=21.17 TRINITY_DN4424_c0_g7_i1:171-1040(-)
MASSSSCLLWLWVLLSFTAFPVVMSLPEKCVTSADCITYEYGTTTCFLDECIRCDEDLEVPFYKDKSTCGAVCDGPGVKGDQQCLTRERYASAKTHCFRLSPEVIPGLVNGYYKYNGTATYKDSVGNVTLISGYCADCDDGQIYDATIFDCVPDPDAPPSPPPPGPPVETPPYSSPASGGGLTEVPPSFDPPSHHPKRNKKKTNVGAIVGSLIGVLGFLGVVAAAVILLIRRHNHNMLAYSGTQRDAPPGGPGPEDALPPPPASMPPPGYPQGDPKPPYPPTQVPTSQV